MDTSIKEKISDSFVKELKEKISQHERIRGPIVLDRRTNAAILYSYIMTLVARELLALVACELLALVA